MHELEAAMIKDKANLVLGFVWLMLAALSFHDRSWAGGLPLHQYMWLLWLLGAMGFFYRSLRPVAPREAREPMRTVPPGKRYVVYVVLFVGLILAAPLWREFHEPGQPLWNGFLAAFLIALVVGSFVGIRYLQKNRIEVGEARFPSVNEDTR